MKVFFIFNYRLCSIGIPDYWDMQCIFLNKQKLVSQITAFRRFDAPLASIYILMVEFFIWQIDVALFNAFFSESTLQIINIIYN